jgi:hypothetical protein
MQQIGPSAQSGASGTGTSPRAGARETFGPEELACVLSHFDIGVIDSIVEFPRGSRKAPKLLIVAEHGKFLLKRRARGKDDPFKVAFCHALQLYLASKQFPLPHLLGTKHENNSMLQWRNAVYEVFEFIAGQGYPQTLESTFDAGKILGLYHKLLEDFKSEWQPPSGSYHLAPAVEQGLRAIPGILGGSRPGAADELAPLIKYLAESYQHAAQTVQELGIDNWPKQIVHADWHPGNMLFRDNRVVAVIDYDSRGYDEVLLLSQAEIKAIPWLMIEALIAEAVFPIAATGNFGRMEGTAFLQMVQRKVYWMQRNAPKLVEMAEG